MPFTTRPLTVSRTLAHVTQNSRRAVVQTLARQAALDLDLHAVGMADTLQSRAQSAVGIGDGVAIIDDTIDHLTEPYLLVAQLAHPIDVNAPDGQPVDIICVLLSPDDRVAHIRDVGRLTRLLRDADLCNQLRGATSADAMAALFLMPVEEILAA